LALREEHRLRVFENRVLRRIFSPKRYEVAGGWRKLHNEEARDLYSSPSIIRIIKSSQLLVTASVTPVLLTLFTMMMEAIRSSEMSVLTRATRRHIPDDGILHSYHRGNLKSYIARTGWAL
jgi:hypothetical protein